MSRVLAIPHASALSGIEERQRFLCLTVVLAVRDNALQPGNQEVRP